MHLRPGHGAVAERDRLVEQRQAVAHRSVRRPGNQPDRFILDRDVFLFRDIAEMFGQLRHVEPAQIETLAARQHGDRHLADFGRREDEVHVLRRLFQRLQQGVEGVLRQHVHFVDDVDLVARGDRLVADAFDQLADVVHAGAAGGVHLHHVDMAVLGDGGALLAFTAGRDGDVALPVRADAVQRAGDDPRGRRLADAADARQHVGMRDPTAVDRVR